MTLTSRSSCSFKLIRAEFKVLFLERLAPKISSTSQTLSSLPAALSSIAAPVTFCSRAFFFPNNHFIKVVTVVEVTFCQTNSYVVVLLQWFQLRWQLKFFRPCVFLQVDNSNKSNYSFWYFLTLI